MRHSKKLQEATLLLQSLSYRKAGKLLCSGAGETQQDQATAVLDCWLWFCFEWETETYSTLAATFCDFAFR